MRPDRRWRAYPLAALISIALLLVGLAITADQGVSIAPGRLGGDYAAFYGAGTIVGAGDWAHLYDADVQAEAQRGLLGPDRYLFFAYPPHVAVAYTPLSTIPFRWSWLLHTLLMGAALGLAVHLVRPWIRWVDEHPLAAVAIALFGYPILRSVTGGQNTSLSLLLVVLAGRGDDGRRWGMTGAAVGAMFFKPQFGLPLLGLLVVARWWRAAGVALLVVLAQWAIAASLMGWSWLARWWEAAIAFAGDASANSELFASLPGVLEHHLGMSGAIIGWALAGAVGATTALMWWRHPHDRAPERYALAAAAIVLATPQPLFYDAGLVALALALLVAQDPGRTPWITLLWIGTWVGAVRGLAGVSSFVVVAATWGWAAANWLRPVIKPRRPSPL